MAGSEPTPEFAAMVAEEVRLLLCALDDDTLRRIATLKMEGFSNEEIAGDQRVALRTVERKLHLIRQIWESMGR
jgi:DNA-directed RNA polymerase specialized sigma24 family protein